MHMNRVAAAYESELGPGIFIDNANAIAPRNPANQSTHCNLHDILLSPCRRQQLATHDRGKMFNARAMKQNNTPNRENMISQFLNRPVKTPIPMYKKTIVSIVNATVAKNCSVVI
mmetsp:Transcript_58111/g.123247  ORF Transcript_58111/g.123247 Transcript_58111/m.123247 type:complete len:115 (+) Transcript_58111:321-665(+)